MAEGALSHLRICDFTGQLAGAGATRFMAAFGAQIIRIEDPTNEGRWDILRGNPPYVDDRKGIDLGGAFNNHNVEKLGITLNLRTERGKQILRELVRISDAVTENFAAGVLERWGFGYEQLKEIRPDVIYVSNCGFGHSGPYLDYKTWGPIVQAVSGLTFSSAIPGQAPAGWGYSYMDHTGAYFMAMAILMAIHHRNVTGEGQWVDLACCEAACTLNGPALLDATINGRPLRRDGFPDANHSQFPPMAPHNIYASEGEDNWIAIACRSDEEWAALRGFVGERWAADARWDRISGRIEWQDELDRNMEAWTRRHERFALAESIRALGIPATAVQRPQERVDLDPNTDGWGLWPTVHHTQMGDVRVDGLPVHLSRTDWQLERGASCLGESNEYVYGEILGLSADEISRLRMDGVI
jgi:crotonobetainyl-CoA:carnitine CoA-transferase CaiB-like acyl-CoA transferase